MLILGALAVIALLALMFGPQWWVRHVMRKHGVDRRDFPGTGGELARHLLDKGGLADVRLEECAPGADHYDPISRAVRLSPENFHGRSITAVTVAAHEVGHALQHRDGDPVLVARTKWAGAVSIAGMAALGVMASIPVLAFFLKSPILIALQVIAIVALLGSRILVHAMTLPLEIDASFKRALPILERGGYLGSDDMPAARSVLTAAALTYVAGALATLLDVLRWWR
jgi:Zn-dependent membrane protease YugP